MKKEQLRQILEDVSSVKIAVLGDFCLDAYWFIDESKSELSIETGLMTCAIRQQKYSLVGAGNVTSNLAAMGVKDIRALRVIGPDPFGSEMVYIMNRLGINTGKLYVRKKSN